MKILKYSNNDDAAIIIKEASKVLKNGGLVVFPTETCYGIGADATNQVAIDKLLEYKTKEKDKPFSIAVSNLDMAKKYAHLNKMALNAYNNYLPGPVTVVSKGNNKLANNVQSSQGTIGIRIPDYKLITDIVDFYGLPMTATSANASYKKTPYNIDDIFNNISQKQKDLIDLVIDAGELKHNPPSTVIDTTLDNIYVLREGNLKLDKPKRFLCYSIEDLVKYIDVILSLIKDSIGKRLIVFKLEGDLGAGKTYFTKELGKKIGVQKVITSPTFNICNEYRAKYNNIDFKLFHIDTYRLFEALELNDLSPNNIFFKPNIVVIEWANKFPDYYRNYYDKAIEINIKIEVNKAEHRLFNYEIKDYGED